MAINYELINKGGISLGTNFELLSEKPLDSRLVVPSLDGLQNYIDSAAAYEGMIAYVSSEKKHYEVKVIDGVLSYRPFGLTEAELNELITNATTAAMEFKGATATLPENPAKGDMYKVAGENISIKIDDIDAKLGDSIVYDGEKWFLIPSGDDIEDTWRPVEGVNNDATLKFVDGDKTVAAVAADGTIKYNHATVAAPADVTAEGDEKTRTYITAVETDGYGHITGYKTATENVEDTNTEYTFESQVESSSVYFNVTPNTEGATEETIYVDAYSKNEADGKFVAKETGKSLVADTEIARLAEVDNYDDEEVRGLIGDNADAIDALSEYVGTIPNVPGEDGNNKYADLDVIGYINKKSQETLAAAQGGSSETAASVKGQLDDYIGENNTRVKAVEDDVAAIKNAETGILKQAQDYADGLAGNYDEAGAAAGVKSELEVEIAKKVDKVEGKSLIDDSEIARLATLANYDDTQVKADIAKKADAETMTTELGKKVDKVDGKDLIATSEIERLATLKNYDDTALAGRVSTAEGKITDLETESAKHALKSELEVVDAKFADYTKTSELPTDLGDFTNNAGYAKTADVNTELNKKADKTQVATDIANAIAPLATTEALNGVDAKFANYTNTTDMNAKFDLKADKTQVATDIANAIAPLATTEALNGVKATAEAAAVKTEVEAALALKADKSVVDAMYTNTQIDGFIAEAKKYADDNDADTKYGIVYDSDAKKIKLVEGGTVAEIDATAFIKDGMIESVTLSEDGLNLVITWNTDSDKGENNVTTIPLAGLVDVYTGVTGDRISVSVSNKNAISADIVAGSISKNYLDDGVQASLAKADSALQSHQDLSHLATTEVLNAKTAGYTTSGNLAEGLPAIVDIVAGQISLSTHVSGEDITISSQADGDIRIEQTNSSNGDIFIGGGDVTIDGSYNGYPEDGGTVTVSAGPAHLTLKADASDIDDNGDLVAGPTKLSITNVDSATLNGKEIATQNYVDEKLTGYSFNYGTEDSPLAAPEIVISTGESIRVDGDTGVTVQANMGSIYLNTGANGNVKVNDKIVATEDYVDEKTRGYSVTYNAEEKYIENVYVSADYSNGTVVIDGDAVQIDGAARVDVTAGHTVALEGVYVEIKGDTTVTGSLKIGENAVATEGHVADAIAAAIETAHTWGEF